MSRESQSGQTLVIVALSMVVLLLMASVAVDVGRFVSERRYLQNAADAAALAGAQEWKMALSRGEAPATAEGSARARALATLHEHFNCGGSTLDPTGACPPDPSNPPVYVAGCGAAPSCLSDGILVNPAADPGSVRVALRNNIDFTFGRAAALIGGNLDFQTISAKARAGKDPNGVGPLPIAVRRYIAPYGPRTPSGSTPCPGYDPIHPEFTDVFATAATSCVGSVTAAAGRVDPSASAPGEDIEIIGQGADPCSSAECGNSPVSFLGFVALDIRNYANAFSQQFFNGVTASTNANTLKQMEAAYFCTGYPGPPFPDVGALSPPNPDLQVAALDGASAGIAVDSLTDCYTDGDLIMVVVYDGIVKKIPEFDMQWPGSNKLGEMSAVSLGTGAVVDFGATKNDVFSGSVSFETIADSNDTNNPLLDGTVVATPPLTYTPNPVTPTTAGNGAAVSVGPLVTSATVAKPLGATPGIYGALVAGTANSYSNVIKYLPLSIKVGSIATDFQITGPTPQGCAVALTAGSPINCTFSVARVPGRSAPGSTTLTLNNIDGSLRQSVGSISGTGSASVSISTSGLSQGLYTFVVRGTATDTAGHTITHLYPFTINVAPQSAPGSDTYVDIIGYAAMQIVCDPSGPQCVGPNSVWAKAITPVLSAPDDPALDVVQPIRLIPWDY
jgi:hypothetical protein